MLKKLIAFTLAGITLVAIFYSESDEDSQDILQYRKSGKDVARNPVVYNPFQVVTENIDSSPDAASPSAFSHYLEVTPDRKTDSAGSRTDAELYTYPDSPENRKMTLSLRRIMTTLQPVLAKQITHYRQSGNWPEPTVSTNPDILRLTGGSSGEIRVYLGKRFGAEKVIRLTPDKRKSTASNSWFCQTNVPNIWLGKGKERVCIYNERLN